MILIFTLLVSVREIPGPTYHYFRTQDVPATLMILPVIMLAFFWWPCVHIPRWMPSTASVLTLAGLLALVLWAGTHWLMLDYPLTRDEHMVVFDAQIFTAHQLAQPLAPNWQPFTSALIPDWLLQVPNNALLISHYLPGNAMMRAGFSIIADPALMNPVFCAIGFIALFDIARRPFSETPAAIWVVLATYLLSTQVLVNAMTNYAMTGHLALDLVWLALFLRGKRWQHAIAMAIGAWAIALHQVTYHPLFVAPFIVMLLNQRRWLLFSAYCCAYGAAFVLWLSYPSIVVSFYGIEASAGRSSGLIGFFNQSIWPHFAAIDPSRAVFMEFNILRFLVWSPLFLIPLVVLAWPDIRRIDSLALPLFLGIVLMLLMRTILLPYQGHGWGYRSIHGLIGNFALLAGYGYVHWAKHDRARADGTVALLGGGTALILIPFLFWSAHQFVAPYARLSAAIERQPSDFVVVDTQTSLAAIDQVRNRADLANRPLVFASSHLSNAQLSELCARGSVTWVGADDIAAAKLPMPAAKLRYDMKLEPARFRGCLRPFDPSLR